MKYLLQRLCMTGGLLLLTLLLTVADATGACGDVNGSGTTNVSDLTYLIGYLFVGGPPPPSFDTAECDNHDVLTLSDASYLTRYLFEGGPAPICPPSLPKHDPTPSLLAQVVVTPSCLPAGDSIVSLTVSMNLPDPAHAILLPMEYRIGGVTPDTISSLTVNGAIPLLAASYSHAARLIQAYFSSVGTPSFPAGTTLFYTCQLKISAVPSDRPITASYISQPPVEGSDSVNIPMIIYDLPPSYPLVSPEIVFTGAGGEDLFPPVCDSAIRFRTVTTLDSAFDILSATDADICSFIRYRLVSISPTPVGSVGLDSLTGRMFYKLDPLDRDSLFTVTWEATDGTQSDTCVIKVLAVDRIHTVRSLYDSISTYAGDTVYLLATYPDTLHGACYDATAGFLHNGINSLRRYVLSDGPPPPDSLWSGPFFIVRGVVTYTLDPDPISLGDTAVATLTAISYYSTFDPTDLPTPPPFCPLAEKEALLPPDAGKFAMIIAGTYDRKNEEKPHWQAVERVFTCLKTRGYPEANITVYYHNGTTRNNALVPQARVRKAQKGGANGIAQGIIDVKNAILAYKVANPNAPTEFEFVVAAHGSATDGTAIHGDLDIEYVSFVDYKNYVQDVISGKVDTVRVELNTCFGGKIANRVNEVSLEHPGGATSACLWVNSASDSVTCSWGQDYLFQKMSRLCPCTGAAKNYTDAVAEAVSSYYDIMVDQQVVVWPNWQNHLIRMRNQYLAIQAINGWFAQAPALAAIIATLQQQIDAVPGNIDALSQSRFAGSPVSKKMKYRKMRQWKRLRVPPIPTNNAGIVRSFTFKFANQPAVTACGNVQLWRRTVNPPTNPLRLERVWNWNNPNSRHFKPGSDRRVFNVPANHTGEMWLQNFSNPHTVLACMLMKRQPGGALDDDPDSPSNIAEFAGFALGGDDGEFLEFDTTLMGSALSVDSVNREGFELDQLPSRLGTCGVGSLTASAPIDSANLWWDSMEVDIDIQQVSTPGDLRITVAGAEVDTVLVPITAADTNGLQIFVGTVPTNSAATVTLEALNGLCFSFDSWGLTTLVSTAPVTSCCMGTRGNVNGVGGITVADLTYLVAYLFNSGPMPPCTDEANVNGAGGITVADLTFLVNFLFNSGPQPAACP